MSLGKRLKEARTNKGLTQEEAAKHLRITFQALSNYERGVRDPDTDLLKSIAALYGVTADYLLGLSDVKTPIKTIAAYHDGDDWTEEELGDIEAFKNFVRSRRKKNE
ncbi:MAG: helix-turn-helix domain-containing protein [Pelotomaculum sp.]|jgi:transcriptional regulator with XRE-family HTH domain